MIQETVYGVGSVLLYQLCSIVCSKNGIPNSGKTLWEMIQPVRTRIESLRNFVGNLESNVQIEVIPTFEAYEAFVKNLQLECMVTTREAIDVAEAANGLRKV